MSSVSCKPELSQAAEKLGCTSGRQAKSAAPPGCISDCNQVGQAVSPAAGQKFIFRANCNWRMSIPAFVAVIRPKVPPGVGVTAPDGTLEFKPLPGSPKLGWLRKLKASNRNWRYM